ncbi:hypothetical protein BLM14_19550 (plasmid) [Phyllobacterium zundukense]|nr:hypothetical protein BLM14_19550 [Phyllobacterium zundukense]
MEQLEAAGCLVTILLYRDCELSTDSKLLTDYAIRFANYSPLENLYAHEFTAYLSALLESESYDSYVDTTPFLAPRRFDIFSCPVIAVCYDFIPLRYPDFYLRNYQGAPQIYYNGLARLVKADHIISISTTVRDQVVRYLGVPNQNVTVMCPTLEERYLSVQQFPDADPSNYVFTILGSHKSKNPEGSLEIYKQLLASDLVEVRLNAPKQDQLDSLRNAKLIPNDAFVSADITDEQKFELQSGAGVVAHLSIEEGFGIPLLEAVFLGRKVLALDIPINRELLEAAKVGRESAVFWLPPQNQTLNLPAFKRFLEAPVDTQFHDAIRQAYLAHWGASAQLIADALRKAEAGYAAWWERIQAKIFSSIPGTSCGVADYSVAYVRSAAGNIAFFFSEGEQENISYLTNVKLFTHYDFQRFTAKFKDVKGLFNFAFSTALHPGLDLARKASRAGDVLLLHERRYFDGFRYIHMWANGVNELLLDVAGAGTEEDRTKLAIDFVFRPEFNRYKHVRNERAPISAQWLRSLPVRTVSHLPPAVIEQLDRQESINPGSIINDMEAIEDDIDFVPLGIDDRRNPAVDRASRLLRVHRGVQMDDIVIGHYGLILNDLKRLWDVTQAVVAAASHRERDRRDSRRVFFFLVGKVIDKDLFERIRAEFRNAGLADRLIHSNPAFENDFDAEIAACDAVACFRVQTRGQLSHIFVRALSLGTPVLVNERSGYGYDPRTTIKEDDVINGVSAAIDLIADKSKLLEMRRHARQHYESSHRGDKSFDEMLRDR